MGGTAAGATTVDMPCSYVMQLPSASQLPSQPQLDCTGETRGDWWRRRQHTVGFAAVRPSVLSPS